MPRSKEQSEQMRIRSRTRILEEAQSLFAEQGYFNSRISDIANAAEMSQGNVYWYFNSKADLLKTILSEGFDAHEEMTRKVAALPVSAEEQLVALIDISIKLYQKQSSFVRILLSLMAHRGTSYIEELGFDMQEIGMRYHQNLEKIFTKALAEGAVVDLDPHILTMFFYAFFNGLIITYGDQWATLPKKILKEAVLNLLAGDFKLLDP
jgi:TetR/AcrR family fatty acid metabolism transcriptional regulator